MEKNMKICVFDLSNILYRSFYANRDDSDDLLTAGLAHASGLMSMNRWYNQVKPDRIYACFDRPSWRKEYTKSVDCISKRPYKGNRRQTMTPEQRKKYEHFLQHVAEFEDILRNHTTIHVLAEEMLEADDLMAAVVLHCSQSMSQSNDLIEFNDNTALNEITIVSSDKDLIQLLKYPNVRLIDPSTGKERTLAEWDNDVEWFMFEKCMRGDRGDNVMSALPRVLTTRLKKAYKDDYEYVNLMKESWSLATTNQTFVVGDIFEENKLLMDLHCQPEHIRERMRLCVENENDRAKHFDYFQFVKFLGKFQLKRISEQLASFVPMLSIKGS